MEAANAQNVKNTSARKKSNLKDAKLRKLRAEVLTQLADGLSVTEVCANADIARETYYNWLRDDPDFARRVEFTRDVRASFIDSVLWHASCRAIGDPKYHRAAIAYLRLHEQRERRRFEQQKWEAEQQRLKEEQQRREAAAGQKTTAKTKAPRLLRRRHTPPLPPKWVRLLVAEVIPRANPTSLQSAPVLLTAPAQPSSSTPSDETDPRPT